MNHIIIRGARQHNLKNIDVVIPRNKFVVLTGVSGSGKSSLAFDTIFAEGERRYIESLSSFARQFLQRHDTPSVEEIKGLSPAIAIEQKRLSRNPRSTVGTLTEIYDYLRLLYTHLGTMHCPRCGGAVKAYTIPQMVKYLFEWPQGSRFLILAPAGKVAQKDLPKVIGKLRRQGYLRILLNGRLLELDQHPSIPRRSSYELEVVVDRLVLREERIGRISDSLESAAKLGKGQVAVQRVDGEKRVFTESFRCVPCELELPELSPSLFSFHHPAGMCPVCKGLGTMQEAEDESLCPSCHGSRLNAYARSVRLGTKGIHEACRSTIVEIEKWLESLQYPSHLQKIAERPVQEISVRLITLKKLGLAYLTLDRSAATLSGGEAQRIRLAQQLTNPLAGVLYILDEPSMGLHPRDHRQLLEILFELRDAGNSLIVVEHDRETILRADHVIDLGPGAGLQGGELVFSGKPQELIRHPSSLTALYLSGRKQVSATKRREPFTRGALKLAGARGHNLKNLSVAFPLGCLTCVTGVSGSGKSTLVVDTLYRALRRLLNQSKANPRPFDSLEGAEHIHKVLLIDQSPIGATPRSTPATYTGIFSMIRRLFAQLPEARARGYQAGRFSFNIKGGRCEACKGEGFRKVEMYFLPDVYVTCPACEGKRYGRETLEIVFKGKSIANVLEMTVNEAAGLFENLPNLRNKLETLQEVGLGYLQLGQPATTLSGGEAQRIKLAAELGAKVPGRTLYILDEPTTGLHFEDISKLLHVLQRLVDAGHTVIIIEHNMDIIRSADYVIDLGPEGGEGGGHVVVAGTPEEIAGAHHSHTAKYLRLALRNEPELQMELSPGR